MAVLFEAACTPDTIEAARLLVSELVTNAVTHTASETVTVEVVVAEPMFRVAVRDQGRSHPRLREQVGPDELHGRGLRMVDDLAARWATEDCVEPDGKVVWFEMACA